MAALLKKLGWKSEKFYARKEVRGYENHWDIFFIKRSFWARRRQNWHAKYTLSWENISGHTDCNFGSSDEKIFVENLKSCLLKKVRKYIVTEVLFPLDTLNSKLTLMPLFLWQTWRLFLKNYLFLQKLLCRHRLHFDRSPEKISRNCEKFSAQGRKKIRIWGSHWSIVFLRQNPLDRWNAVLETMQKFFCQKISFEQTQKPSITISVKNYHLWKKLFWRYKLLFWQPSFKNFRPNRKLYT